MSGVSKNTGSRSGGLVLGAVFVVAGLLHFVYPKVYERVVPPYLPAPLALVYVSGVAEVAGGLGVVFGGSRTRRYAGLGLISLLVAVFPANVHMAVNPDQIPGLDIPPWMLWARLPMQPALIAVVWWMVVRKSPTAHS